MKTVVISDQRNEANFVRRRLVGPVFYGTNPIRAGLDAEWLS